MNNITLEEKNRISDSNLHLFIARHIHDYYPCAVNSQRMIDFLESQFGMTLAQWPYPLHLEEIETAFFYLQSQHMLFPRPADEPEPEDPEVIRERNAAQKVRDDYAARRQAERTQQDKNMSLKELGNKVSQQNVQFREQRDRNELPTRTLGLESRSLATVEFGDKATARANVALQNPTLDRNGAEFARLYALELNRLRG